MAAAFSTVTTKAVIPVRRLLLIVLVLLLLGVPGAAAWTWPVTGPVLSTFSFDHDHPYAGGQRRGIDIGAAVGTPVAAPAGGTVSFAGTVPSNGRVVTIETGDGYSVTLVHLGSIGVAKGSSVSEGQSVGTVGPADDGAAPFVHLGVRVTSDPQGYLDPLAFLPPVPAPAPPAAASPDPAAAPATDAGAPAAAPDPVAAAPVAPPAPAAPAPVVPAPGATDPAAPAPAATDPAAPLEPPTTVDPSAPPSATEPVPATPVAAPESPPVPDVEPAEPAPAPDPVSSPVAATPPEAAPAAVPVDAPEPEAPVDRSAPPAAPESTSAASDTPSAVERPRGTVVVSVRPPEAAREAIEPGRTASPRAPLDPVTVPQRHVGAADAGPTAGRAAAPRVASGRARRGRCRAGGAAPPDVGDRNP